LNLALREPPRYAAADHDPALHQAFMVILGLERFDQFRDIVKAHESGQIPATVMWGACPTQFDPRQAPSPGHTAFMWEKVPYAIQGDARKWDQIAQQHGEQLLQLWASYAPNLRDAMLDAFARTPLDTERTLPNMQGGDLLVGAFANGQIGENRPFAGAGRYRTPLDGLYLCGGSTHPGGNITGLCGYNAARVVATDLNCRIWWNPPDAEHALRSLT
jgi:phytoene dehydrogenase-like protein